MRGSFFDHTGMAQYYSISSDLEMVQEYHCEFSKTNRFTYLVTIGLRIFLKSCDFELNLCHPFTAIFGCAYAT